MARGWREGLRESVCEEREGLRERVCLRRGRDG